MRTGNRGDARGGENASEGRLVLQVATKAWRRGETRAMKREKWGNEAEHSDRGRRLLLRSRPLQSPWPAPPQIAPGAPATPEPLVASRLPHLGTTPTSTPEKHSFVRCRAKHDNTAASPLHTGRPTARLDGAESSPQTAKNEKKPAQTTTPASCARPSHRARLASSAPHVKPGITIERSTEALHPRPHPAFSSVSTPAICTCRPSLSHGTAPMCIPST